MVDAYPHSIDASVLSSSNATQLPEELFELILEYLCVRRQAVLWDRSPFDRSLGECSLTCRYWAAHIRPTLFSKVVLQSQKDATTFAALVRSSIAVPGLLRVAVRTIELIAVEGSRPWIHHVWTLLRDGVLPNLQSIDLMIHGSRSLKVSHDGQANRHRCEVFYAIGLPRTVPSAHVFRLRTLLLRRLQFRSCEALVRCVASLDAETIDCAGLQWPKEVTALPALATIRHAHARIGFSMQKRVLVRSCTAISPFFSCLITAHLLPPGVARRLVYINPHQIATVMGILRLFSDECECSVCARAQRLDRDEDVVYWRENHLLQAYIDPTDRATACLSITYARAHTLAMQIGPTGVVSRLRLETSHASIFPSSARNLHYDQSFAAPIVLEGTFTRLDRLCESLSDTLREVTIGLDRPGTGGATAQADHLTTTLRRLRDQMPNMARRHRLVFSVLTNDLPAASDDGMYSGAARDLFKGDGQCYSNVALEL